MTWLMKVGLVVFLAATNAQVAAAERLTVISTTAVRELLEAILPLFQQDTGIRVDVTFIPARQFIERFGAGIDGDVVVTSSDIIEPLQVSRQIDAGGTVNWVRSKIGVAVRAGAPKPNITTIESFKRTLLTAHSVAVSMGPSGVYVGELLNRLGIAPTVTPKLVFTAPGERVGEVLATGRAEIGIQQIPELLATPGCEFIGPLPAALQTTVQYRVLRLHPTQSVSALMTFLTSKKVAQRAVEMGFERQ